MTASDQLRRIDIRAPQAGFVHQLAVHTKSEVVGAGEAIALIVPSADALIVEVKVAPYDIDQVLVNQPATLRFPTFNQHVTPELSGTVWRIAADVVKDAGTPYYPVRITIDGGEIERLNGQRLVPGMPVEAFIRTAIAPCSPYAQATYRSDDESVSGEVIRAEHRGHTMKSARARAEPTGL